MSKRIYINGFSSISAYGFGHQEVEDKHSKAEALFSDFKFQDEIIKVTRLSSSAEAAIQKLISEQPKYARLDRSVLMAILCTRACIENQKFDKTSTGLNIGSSRGATELFETYHQEYIQQGQVSALSSPTTTLGNLATWPAQDIGLKGVQISHSITCSTALHGFLNAKAWLQSNMSEAFIVGGSESPLTHFTIAQMKAIKLYSNLNDELPCRSLDLEKQQNSLILAEAAGTALLTKQAENALAEVVGFGYATEMITHNISISTDALCFQDAMKMALKEAQLDTVDAVVMHAPGTKKGDQAEINAVNAVFKTLPLLTTNKWQIGHSFGASGMLSIQTALYMLNNGFYKNPFYEQQTTKNQPIKSVLVNAVGFGGNAVSLILKAIN